MKLRILISEYYCLEKYLSNIYGRVLLKYVDMADASYARKLLL
jgi:hypothetical protein